LKIEEEVMRTWQEDSRLFDSIESLSGDALLKRRESLRGLERDSDDEEELRMVELEIGRRAAA
jgi:hypothetical protein